MRSLLVLLVLGLLAACRTERSSAPPAPDDAILHGLVPRASWEVLAAGAAAGSIVCFEETVAPHRRLFVVRNTYSQDVGRIDANGRAWRDHPHREPEWVGAGTLAEGARLILGLRAPVILREVPLETLSGSADEAR